MKKTAESIITSVLLIITGVMLFVFPSHFLKYACFAVGGCILAVAALKLLLGLITNTLMFKVFPILFLSIAGICVIEYNVELLDIIPIVIGICFLLYDLFKIMLAFKIKKIFPKAFAAMFIPAAIGVAIALALIILNSFIPSLVVKFLGILLMYNSIDNIFSAFIRKKKENIQKQSDKRPDVIEADFEEKD